MDGIGVISGEQVSVTMEFTAEERFLKDDAEGNMDSWDSGLLRRNKRKEVRSYNHN